jgi:peptide chain release factor 1
VVPLLERLRQVEEKYEALELQLADPEVAGNWQEYNRLAKERSDLEAVVAKYREYAKLKEDEGENRRLLTDADADLRALAQEELAEIGKSISALEEELRVLLLPRDPNDGKNVFLEIRAGTGGEEAALFAADLFRMYSKYAEDRRWKVEVMSMNHTGVGGYKEVIASIEGKGAYSMLKYEAGVHRVQRVPTTEASGRIHTSAVTVAVLPEAEEVDVKIPNEDIRVDVYRSSGPGGQSVNTTDSAVRMTHIPSGLVVTCQDEKSQHKNKAKAMRILRARVQEQIVEEQEAKRASERRGMVGSGDRSERVRTYNFPQNRVTDHRIGVTLYRLDTFLEGDIQEMIDALSSHYQSLALSSSGEAS